MGYREDMAFELGKRAGENDEPPSKYKHLYRNHPSEMDAYMKGYFTGRKYPGENRQRESFSFLGKRHG